MVMEPPSNNTNIGGGVGLESRESRKGVGIGLWELSFGVSLGIIICYCKVLFFTSYVHPRCGLPSNKWMLVSMLDPNASSIGLALRRPLR